MYEHNIQYTSSPFIFKIHFIIIILDMLTYNFHKKRALDNYCMK